MKKFDKFHIKVNDKVKVLTGKDKGKIGKVKKIVKKNDQIVVENINMIKRHTKPNMKNQSGGIIEREGAINMSNVMLMCDSCVKPVRVGMQILKDGKKLRVCKKCKEAI